MILEAGLPENWFPVCSMLEKKRIETKKTKSQQEVNASPFVIKTQRRGFLKDSLQD